MKLERIRISPDGRTFRKGTSPFFYFADTVWSSFTNTSIGEWKEYLAVRKGQGFNTLQINILPQWDRSRAASNPGPFKLTAAGEWDFFNPDPSYFDHAEKLVSLAAESGMYPALVLLWCNFVPDTWAAKRGLGQVMPFDAVSPYVEYAAKLFKPYSPIYLVSGDSDYSGERTVPHYAEALRTVKRVDPDCLTTLHSQPDAGIPDALSNMPELDFYMYQSGHIYEEQYRTWEWAEHFMKAAIRRPTVNGEPCYDGHKHGMKQGRFCGLDIRRAFFQSLLCGARAGFTYGAHGLWGWHEEGDPFNAIDFSGSPYPWRTALGLEGAWDTAYCVHLAEEYGLREMEPLADMRYDFEPFFIAADENMGRFALYLPAAAPASIPFDATQYDSIMFMLGPRRVGKPDFRPTEAGSCLHMPDTEEDILIVGKRR